MEIVKLTDICSPKQWKTISGKDLLKEGFPVYGANGVIGYWSDYNHENETVTIACRGTCGTVNIVPAKSYINGNAMSLDNLSNRVKLKYLYYYLKGYDFKEVITGTTIPQITIEGLRKVKVPVLPLDDQEYLVKIFDKTQSLIDSRKAELSKLDELIKARFVEMFGDYHTNSKGFETHKGSELFRFSSGKFLPEERRLETGIPVYGGNGIAWYTDTPLIDYPSIIIGRVGAQCGNIHVVTEPVWITDNAIYIKEQKTEKFTLEFLSEMMRIMDFYQYADFSGQPKITQKPLETLAYLTPPIVMQEAFTDFCAQVDKSKVVVQKALNEAQLLFDSLMQQYFG